MSRQHRQSHHRLIQPTRLDIDKIHQYLTHSARAKGISREMVNESILNSLCFGLFAGTEQIGFARVVTDGVTFGYLCDVYIIDEYQKQKLGHWLIALESGEFYDVNDTFDRAGVKRPYATQREWLKRGGIPANAIILYMYGSEYMSQYDFSKGAPDEEKLTGWKPLSF